MLEFVTAQHTGTGVGRLQLAGDGAGTGVSGPTVRQRLSSVSGLLGFLHARGDAFCGGPRGGDVGDRAVRGRRHAGPGLGPADPSPSSSVLHHSATVSGRGRCLRPVSTPVRSRWPVPE